MIEDWKKNLSSKWKILFPTGVFNGVFVPAQSREDIQRRYSKVKAFLQDFHGVATLRVMDSALERIHFSTSDTDILTSSDFRVAYNKVTSLPDHVTPDAVKNDQAQLVMDPDLSGFQVFLPFTDDTSNLLGVVNIFIPLEDLRLWLLDKKILDVGEWLYLVDNNKFLFSRVGKLNRTLLDGLKSLMDSSLSIQKISQTEDQQEFLLLLNKLQGSSNRLGLVIASSNLKLDSGLKIVISGSLYMILFLTIFFILNLRNVPLAVVSRQIKRFQIQVLKEYLDLKEKEKITSLRKEFSYHSDRIKKDIRRNLGRISKKDETWVDNYLDRSWKEVLELLGNIEKPQAHLSSEPLDWHRLENFLRELLTTRSFQSVQLVDQVQTAATGVQETKTPVEESVLEDEVEELDEVEAAQEIALVSEVLEDEQNKESDKGEELDEVEAAQEIALVSEVLEDEQNKESDKGVEVLELSGEVDSSDAELEDLGSYSTSSTDIFFPRGTLEAEPLDVLEAIEDDREPEAALEELSLDNETLTNVLIPEIESYVEVKSYTVAELDRLFDQTSQIVFDENNEVITLSENLFKETGFTPLDELGQLIQSVTLQEETPFSNLAHEDELMLVSIVRHWKWVESGFDWSSFSPHDGEVAHYKALLDAALMFESFAAALLVKEEDVWKSSTNVGFSDVGKEFLFYEKDNMLTSHCLSKPGVHFLNNLNRRNTLVNQSLHARDLKFLKSVLLVSVFFLHKNAWLLLALKDVPKNVITLLGPRSFQGSSG